MRKAYRGGDDLTMRKAKRVTRSTNKAEWVSGLPVDSTQDAWNGLSAEQKSYLSRSVVSIALCRGCMVLFSCSGIAMERQGSTTRFLTSATLGKELYHRSKDCRELKIYVGHENNSFYVGHLDEYDLDRNLAVVSVFGCLDAQLGPFQRALEILPHDEVLVAVGRGLSGEIMAKSVELNGKDDEDLHYNESEAWEGGPVLFADHVVGMNLHFTTRRAIFKPWGTILKHLKHCWTSQQMSRVFRVGSRPMGEKSITYPHIVQGYYFKKDLVALNSQGYPKLPPTMLQTGMILVNNFEDPFGDIHDGSYQGVWSKLRKRASDIDCNVVALASFKGEQRFFACSGFFIEQEECATILTSASLVRNSGDENKIVENLRIEVLIKDKCMEGTLKDYNLHCNVALVSVKGCCAPHPLTTVIAKDFIEVAAVGRCFESHKLMATSGEMSYSTGSLDCTILRCSTCKITKAGIGGPLVNLDGDVVGMNFYDARIGTPYLAWEDIMTVLNWFATKRVPKPDEVACAPFSEVVGNEKSVLNRWPVPMPYWRHPDFVDEYESDDDEPKSDSETKYFYLDGVKFMLY